MPVENVKYIISAKDKSSKTFDKLDSKSKGLDKTISSLGKKLAVVFSGVLIGRGIKSVAQLGAEMEQTEIAFNTFLGSAEKGREVISKLNEFANVTPFDNEEILKTGRVLLSANVPAEKLTKTLKTIGDIAAGTKVPIAELGNIYAKSLNKGKLQAEELNQLAERGIPIIDTLAKKYNITSAEVFEMGSKGKITSKVLTEAFETMTGEGGLFFNLMQKQSKSTSGLLSTLKGKAKLAGIELGKRFLPSIKNTTKGLIGLADRAAQFVKIPMSKTLEDQRVKLNALIISLNDSTKSEEDRLTILNEIKEISPEVVKSIKKEGDQYKISTDELRKFNTEQLNRILIQKKQEDIDKFKIKLNELGTKTQEKFFKIQETRANAIFKISKKNKKDGKLVQDLLDGTIKKETSLAELREKYGEENALLINQSGLQISKNQKEFVNAQNIAIRQIARRNGLTLESIGFNEEFYNLQRKFNPLFNAQEQAQLNLKNLEAERVKLAKALGIELAGGDAPKVTGIIEGAEDVTAGVTKITSAAPKVFNIVIQKLTGIETVETTTIQEGATQAGEIVLKEVTAALNQLQLQNG